MVHTHPRVLGGRRCKLRVNLTNRNCQLNSVEFLRDSFNICRIFSSLRVGEVMSKNPQNNNIRLEW